MNYRNSTLATLILLMALALACSSARDDPLLSAEELYTPTPIPVDTPVASDTPADPETKTQTSAEPEAEATAEPADLFGFDYNGKVAFAQWDDPSVQMENFIVGYIIVHGMVYEMELVEVGESDYPSALQSGDVDVVLEASPTASSQQFKTLLGSGEVLDVGSLFGDTSDIRIGVRADLKETAPPVFDLLSKVEADEEVLSDLASRIRGGRVGVSASVAGMMFLKQHEDVWTTWIPPETVANVKAAMEENKAGLKYKCLPVRGETVRHCK
ncbi:MAG: hypothetical protein F4W93_08990 [Dehalococcoidia bacterium]|nr:hypothetical protein [Dehalococcoidia bacterium]